MPLKAGKARRDITPSRPLFLVGYPHVPRRSTGVHDPLLATALSLDDGATAIILIAVDILFVERATADECRAAIRRSTGVPEGNILISATHTHSGPVTAPMLAWKNDPLVPPPDPGYMELFRRGIIQAGIEAHASAVPAEMAATTARIEGVGGNRHSPHGAFDPEAGLLYVREKGDGRPLALNLTYAMHPTVLHEDSKLVSSDFPHYARLVVEQQLPGVSVLYHNGPCGNLSLRFHVSGQTFAEAERVGRRLGALVLEALRALPSAGFRDDLVIRAAQESVDLPGQVDMMFAGNDQTANAVSVGPEAGELIVTLGTALVVYRHAGSQPGPYHNACPALRGAVCWGPYPGGGFYELATRDEGCAALDWAQQQLAPIGDLSRFMAAAESATAGADVFFYPERKGTSAAWSGEGDLPQKARAVVEGISFSLRQLIEDDLRMKSGTYSLRVQGGGSASDFWLHLLADILGCDVRRGAGDALLGAAAMAAGGRVPAASAGRTFRPGSVFSHRYQVLYRDWLKGGHAS